MHITSKHKKPDTSQKGRFQLQQSHLSIHTPFAYGLRGYENRVLPDIKNIVAGVSKEVAKPLFAIFFSECPTYDFRNNSGLSLEISKLIIGGNEDAIWAKNIRSTLTGAASETLGVSFVACLSV